MITNNLKKVMGTLLGSIASASYGMVPIVATNGNTYYAAGKFDAGWPAAPSRNLSTALNTDGIMLGTGNTPATANDYKIETLITSGLTAVISYTRSYDSVNGYVDTDFTIVLTNNTNNDIVIKEISYNQKVYATSSAGGTSASLSVFCFDRTVLENPVTVEHGQQTTIVYKLRSILSL